MKLTKIEHHDEIAVLRFTNGVTNPINLEFVKAISESIKILKRDNSVKGVVLASDNHKFFSIGFDIPKLYEQSRDGVKLFYESFNRLSLDLYTLPKPTIAAITGHATAGGCILALCCDYRFIAEGRKLMGLNEIKLGLPVPYPADCILRQLVGDRNATEIMYTGDFYNPEESVLMGMVDQVLPLDQVLTTSINIAKSLGAMPSKAFSLIKRNRVEEVEAKISKKLKEKEALFLERWFSDETQEFLKEAKEKF